MFHIRENSTSNLKRWEILVAALLDVLGAIVLLLTLGCVQFTAPIDWRIHCLGKRCEELNEEDEEGGEEEDEEFTVCLDNCGCRKDSDPQREEIRT